MRSWLSAGALALAIIAVVVSLLDGAGEALGFFIVAATAAGVQLWAGREPSAGWRRRIGIGVAVGWVIAAAWIGALLVMYQAASRPPPGPEMTFLGLTATVYHLVALSGGAVLVTVSALPPPAMDGESDGMTA